MELKVERGLLDLDGLGAFWTTVGRFLESSSENSGQIPWNVHVHGLGNLLHGVEKQCCSELPPIFAPELLPSIYILAALIEYILQQLEI